jgi:hypothetical protein
MRMPRRFPHRALLVLAVLAALAGVPRAAQLAGLVPAAHRAAAHSAAAPPAAAPPAAAHPAAAHPAPAPHALPYLVAVHHQPALAASAVRSGTGLPLHAVTLADRQPVATAGGLCGVPGIGDIGSLFGFCTLGQSGLTGDLNNICQPSLPDPEQANSGIDAMIRPPAAPGPQPATLYSSYGVAGQYWAATNLQCSDMTSLIGNNVASMVFDIAKSIDRVTITVYQSAAGNGILSWLTNVVDKLVSSLGNAIYFPYLAAVVIIGAIWLAWQGLIRRRGTRTIEGTIWMVVACAAAIWLIGRPADFTGMGTDVSNGISQSLNTAFAKLPAPTQSNCLPVGPNDPQVQPANFNFSSGGGIVAENANELWSVLVCKPWLAGEFGTTTFSPPGAQTPVNAYGRQLLWAQAIATNETPTNALIQAKQAIYSGIATSIQQKDPGIYPLFQGKQWTTRLEIGFAALFAAAIAGVLVLLIAVTLILLKLGFLLLLVVGPFFLLIGTHPGFGRVVAVRWFEMLVGVLLKQAAVALVLSVLLYAYSLIMGTSDTVLPWALKILMIALVTIAVFIYRRPFQHLFSAVGYGMIGSTERAEIDMQRYRASLRENTLGVAAAAVPGLAAYRAARWARRNPVPAAALAGTAGGAAGAAAAAGGPAADGATATAEDGPSADGTAAGIAPPEGGTQAGSRAGLASRARARAASATADGARRSAPPLNLPPRGRAGPAAGRGSSAVAGPGRTAADAAAVAAGSGAGQAGAAPPRPAASGPLRIRPGAPRPAPASQAPAGSVPAGPSRTAPAPAGPSRATPAPRPAAAPASPPPAGPARAAGPAAPAPGSAAPAGPSSWPSGSGWPWRPGATASPAQRPPSAPSAAPGSAPAGPSGRSQRGPWADSSAGRQSAAPARSPARAPAPQSARPPAAPSRHPAVPPPTGSAGPLSGGLPAGQPGRRPASPSGRQSAAPTGRSPAPPTPRAPAAPDPARRNPSDRRGGPWFATPAGRQGAAAPGRPAASPGREPSRQGETAGPPRSGSGAAEPPDGPFWLRPMRRKK